jgi:uncharacterized membrane protein
MQSIKCWTPAAEEQAVIVGTIHTPLTCRKEEKVKSAAVAMTDAAFQDIRFYLNRKAWRFSTPGYSTEFINRQICSKAILFVR